jgi:hypothetical protein
MKYKYFLNFVYVFSIIFFIVQLMYKVVLPYLDMGFDIKSQPINKALFLVSNWLGFLFLFMILTWLILIIHARWQSKDITRSWNGISLLVIFIFGLHFSQLKVVNNISGKITNYLMQPFVKTFLEDYYQEQIRHFEQRIHKNISERIMKQDLIENAQDEEDFIAWIRSDESKNIGYRAEIFDNLIKLILLAIAALSLLFSIIVSEPLIAMGFVLLSVLIKISSHHIFIRDSGTWIFIIFFLLFVINLAIMVHGLYRWNNRFKLNA